MTSDIKDYILRSREGGVSDNVIKTALINLGHSRAEIEQVYIQLFGSPKTESKDYFTQNSNIQFGNQPAVATPEDTAKQEEALVEKRSKNKKIVIIIIAAILLIGVGGASFAYYNYTQGLPSSVLKKFDAAWPKIQSFRNNLTISALITPEKEAPKQLAFNLVSTGSFDFSAPAGAKLSDELTVSSEDFKNFSPVGLNMRYLNHNLYFQSWDLGKFPYLDLSSLNGSWIRAGSDIPEYASGTFGSFKINIKSAPSDIIEGIKTRFETAMQNPPTTFVKELPGELIDGISAYHYLFNIDALKIDDFAGKIFGLTDAEISENKIKRTGYYDSVTTSTLELWVRKTDFLPAKINIDIEWQGVGSFTDKIVIENIFRDINTQLTISEPNSSRDAREIFSSLSAQLNSTSSEPAATTTEPVKTSTTTQSGASKTPVKK